MEVYGELKRAQTELVSSDPVDLFPGRLWYNTVSSTQKYYNGAIREVANLDEEQTFTNKTLTSPNINGVNFGIAETVYIGDATTDGSWRFYIDGGNLAFEKRVSGTWTKSHEMTVS